MAGNSLNGIGVQIPVSSQNAGQLQNSQEQIGTSATPDDAFLQLLTQELGGNTIGQTGTTSNSALVSLLAQQWVASVLGSLSVPGADVAAADGASTLGSGAMSPGFPTLATAAGSSSTDIVSLLTALGSTAAGQAAVTPMSVALTKYGSTAEAGASSDSTIERAIQSAAGKYGVPSSLIRSVIDQESGMDPNAQSSAGAIGLMQLMPATALGLGVNPWDPAQNIDGGVRYLSNLLNQFHGDVRLALAAYNAGPGAVQAHGGIPPYAETQNYVQSVLAKARANGFDASNTL